MDWKAFALGAAAGGLVGAGIGYWFATRWEVVDDDYILEPTPQEEPEEVPEAHEDEEPFDEIRIAETIRKYQPFSEDVHYERREQKALVELFDEYALDVEGVAPSEIDTEAYIISNITYDETKSSWDKIHMTYYPDYDLVVTDEEDISHNPVKCFGELVVDFVKGNRDVVMGEKTIYVRNSYTSTDYEVDIRGKGDAEGWIADYLEGLDG